jgi:hypothetical protein
MWVVILTLIKIWELPVIMILHIFISLNCMTGVSLEELLKLELVNAFLPGEQSIDITIDSVLILGVIFH